MTRTSEVFQAICSHFSSTIDPLSRGSEADVRCQHKSSVANLFSHTFIPQHAVDLDSVGKSGIFRFVEPDLTVPAEDRAMFANARPKRLEQMELPLHDFRTSGEVAKGYEGLDTQDFTYINHASALCSEQMLQGRNAEEKLAPEVLDMMLKFTGAKIGVVHNIAFRRVPASKQLDLEFVPMRDSAIDQIMAKIPKNRMMGT